MSGQILTAVNDMMGRGASRFVLTARLSGSLLRCVWVYVGIKHWYDRDQQISTDEDIDYQSPLQRCPGQSPEFELYASVGSARDCGQPYYLHLVLIPDDQHDEWYRSYISQKKPIPAQPLPRGAQRLTDIGYRVTLPSCDRVLKQVGKAA